MAVDKQIYCIRHGESQFNEWRARSLWNFTWITTRDPMILDPRLSRKGEQQVAALYDTVRARRLHDKIQVIVSSPLTRAIQTAAGGFRESNIPMILEASCREMLDTSSDIGRHAHEISKDFDALNLDVSNLEEHWWIRPELRANEAIVKVPATFGEVARLRETKAHVDTRIREFILKLAGMEQHHIAVVGHSWFFKRMLRMNRKLDNCELTVVSLRELADRNGISLDETRCDEGTGSQHLPREVT